MCQIEVVESRRGEQGGKFFLGSAGLIRLDARYVPR